MNRPPSEPLVRIEAISKTYHPTPAWMRLLIRTNITQDVVALDGISFEVKPAEICAIVGPNGAGKTTAFRILVGLTTADQGRATVMGFDCHHQSLEVRRIVGWMPADDRSLLMRLTAAENLRFHGRLQGLKGRALTSRIDATIDLVGLNGKADDSVISLSAGMRARLQLARALLHDPTVLILDEPTASVDPVAAHELLGIIIRVVNERGLAALISSHRLEEIEALQSKVVLLDRGRVRFTGDLEVLRRDWDHPRIEVRFSSPAAAAAALESLHRAGFAATPTTDSAAIQVALSGNGVLGTLMTSLGDHLTAVVEVREIRTPLRDVLAQMYARHPNASESP